MFDCESCTRPISATPVPTGADEFTLIRGSCFVAGRLELAAIALLLPRFWGHWAAVIVFKGQFSFFYFVFRCPVTGARIQRRHSSEWTSSAAYTVDGGFTPTESHEACDIVCAHVRITSRGSQ